MSSAQLPRYDYIVFIDEAGDPGLTKVQPIDQNGASEWMTVGAALVHASDEATTVEWVKQIRRNVRGDTRSGLHFRNLSDAKKELVTKYISDIGITRIAGFVVVSHKPNMKGWKNSRAESVNGDRGWFYNWCIRLVLERVTNEVYNHAIGYYGEPRFMKIVFSERGGTKYGWMRQYLERLVRQAEDGTTFLEKRVIKREVIHPALIEVIPHIQSAGCQLADCITSSFHCAADASGNRWNTRPAEILRPILPKEHEFWFDYSVVLQPDPWIASRALNLNQKKIFRFYQYDI